jgi:uncharacterized membrane protein YtjA (UPF0391 family)
MLLRRWCGRMSVVAAFAAVVGMGGVAEAATSRIAIRDTATLEARGAAVVLRVVVQCPRGYDGRLNVQVSERVTRRHVTNGFGGASFTCTGSSQLLRVPAASFDYPFERGSAFAQAGLDAFDPNTGMFVSDSAYRTIHIT